MQLTSFLLILASAATAFADPIRITSPNATVGVELPSWTSMDVWQIQVQWTVPTTNDSFVLYNSSTNYFMMTIPGAPVPFGPLEAYSYDLDSTYDYLTPNYSDISYIPFSYNLSSLATGYALVNIDITTMRNVTGFVLSLWSQATTVKTSNSSAGYNSTSSSSISPTPVLLAKSEPFAINRSAPNLYYGAGTVSNTPNMYAIVATVLAMMAPLLALL
jgi:hypothetical protein